MPDSRLGDSIPVEEILVDPFSDLSPLKVVSIDISKLVSKIHNLSSFFLDKKVNSQGLVFGGIGECGDVNFPGIYTRINDPKNAQFILQTLRDYNCELVDRVEYLLTNADPKSLSPTELSQFNKIKNDFAEIRNRDFSQC